VGKAFVVPRGSLAADELIAWSRERMAGFKVPRYVEFLEELPLNATGKVMKDQLL
jgi:acyl-CoA synthetase (AMP-forming)/AMP-acid ligase II